jgi:hypothetical protein
MPEREYTLFCDESDAAGRFYSNFYGGVIVGASQYDRITARLNAEKLRLNLFGEVKWSKVSASYVGKYEELIRVFFSEISAGHARVRIMFRQNAHAPIGLSREQIEGTYFRLYYQFIKHAFGLQFHAPPDHTVHLKLFFDEFPETREASTQFKGFILGLKDSVALHRAGWAIRGEDVAEVRSHDHVLAQCLDIVLGSMAFRLNDKHKEIPEGQKRRGKRTVAKERLYKTILGEIRRLRPGFNVGISTGNDGDVTSRWSAPYLHWRFVPADMEFRGDLTKRGKKLGPTQPT